MLSHERLEQMASKVSLRSLLFRSLLIIRLLFHKHQKNQFFHWFRFDSKQRILLTERKIILQTF